MLLNPPVKGAFRLAAWSGRKAASRPALGLRQWFCLPSSQSAAMFPGRLLRISHNALGKPHYRSMAVYSSELWDEIRGKLSMFPGGSVNLVKQESGIAVLTVNNPDRMNAFSGTMMLELQDRVSQLENWKEGKGLIVHGAGGTFCSGSDLNAVRAISNPQDGMKMCMFMQDTLTRLLRLPLISVALVEGRALGGGAELTTACDFRLMTPSSEIQFVHKHMGLVPGWGGAARLVRIVGSQGALKLLAAALKVDSALAEKIGLSDGVVATGAGTALAEAEHWLSDFTRGPAPVIQAIKKVALSGRELPLEDALREEKEVFGTVWGGSANLEALARKSKHK